MVISCVCDFVCLCVCALKEKPLELPHIILGGMTSACIDREVERSKVMVTRLSEGLAAGVWVRRSIRLLLRFLVFLWCHLGPRKSEPDSLESGLLYSYRPL